MRDFYARHRAELLAGAIGICLAIGAAAMLVVVLGGQIR